MPWIGKSVAIVRANSLSTSASSSVAIDLDLTGMLARHDLTFRLSG
jgi:hypothetical protein